MSNRGPRLSRIDPSRIIPQGKDTREDGRWHKWPTPLEAELLRDLGRKSFWMFFLDVFGAGMNPKGQAWITPEVHKPIADWFQHHVDEWMQWRADGVGRQKQLAFLVPRGFGKSTMITQAGQLWLHARDPEMSSFTGCESNLLSSKMLDGVKGAIDGSDPYSLFTRLYGSWSANARSWTKAQITHSARKNTSRRDPSLGTFSVETSIVGSHPDAIFYDDPISYERLTTDTNWLNTVWSQVTSLIPVLQRDGLLVWVGTRYDPDDHFGRAFDMNNGNGVKSLTGMETDSIEVNPDGQWDVYYLSARDKERKAYCPKIWDEASLARYEKIEPLRSAAQLYNDPSLAETNPITKDQLRQCLCKPQDVPWGMLRYAFVTDTAFWDGRSQVAKDETCMYSIGYPRNGSGDVYVVEGYGSNTWRAEDFAKRLVMMHQRYRAQGRRVFAITDEVTMAGKKGAWISSLRNYFHDANEPMPPFIEFNRGGTKKIQRIIAAISYVVDSHVKFVDGGPGIAELIEQLSRVGQMMVNRRMRDDRADAFADAFQPELYQPMRRGMGEKADAKPPWDRSSRVLEIEGLDLADFQEDDSWTSLCPRQPIR